MNDPESQTPMDPRRPPNGIPDSSVTPEPPGESTDQSREPQTPSAAKPGEVSVIGAPSGETRERVDGVLQSELGITTLLNRLKMSITSAKDFALFLKKRSGIEEEHAQAVKKLSQAEMVRKADGRQDSFAYSNFEMARVYDRMADQGLNFALDLHHMSDELHDLAATMERGRKHWKQTGLNAEKRVQDSEIALEKSKSKYYSLAEQYDRARTGEKQSGRFGLKKSGPQQEDDLLRKVRGADSDYAAKVQATQQQQGELLSMLRPQTVKALYDLISECDSGLSAQTQKFAMLNERLLLSNALCVNPLKSQESGNGPQPKGLREIAQVINNERDLQEYILSFSTKVGPKPAEIKYEKHAVLESPKQPQYPPQQYNPSQQYGYSGPPNVGLGVDYNQGGGYGPPPGGTQPQGRDGPPMGQYGQQPGGHPSQMSNHGPPILPQIETSPPEGEFDNFQRAQSGKRLDYGQPMNPGSAPRPGMGALPGPGPVPFNPNHSASQGPPGASNDFRSVSGPVSQNRSASGGMPGGMSGGIPGGPANNYQPPPGPPGQGNYANVSPPATNPSSFRGPSGNFNNVRPGEAPPPQNNGYRPDGRGPSINQGQNFQSDNRVSPQQVQGNYQGDNRLQQPQTQGSYQGDNRGPPAPIQGSYQGDNRGPAAPNQGPNQSDNRGPIPNQGGYQGENRGPMLNPISGQPPQARTSGPNADFGPNPASPPNPPNGANMPNAPPVTTQPRRSDVHRQNLPPLNPVFGITLDDLFRRDGSAVPTIVYQCIQAVDLFGLDTVGVYRTSGSAPHIMEMKALFDHDSTQVDFRDPANFHHDIASVTTLLKHFLRDLPDPLLTSAQYGSFIRAAQIDDDTVRRDSLHAIINSLPDPNYATLRVLTLHLHRVAEHSAKNKMTPATIATCFGPTLTGLHAQGSNPGDMREVGWQARVVETILMNAMQIFDDDE